MSKDACMWPFGCANARGGNSGREFNVAGRQLWACDHHAPLVNVGGVLLVEGLRAGANAAARRIGSGPVRDVIAQAASVIRASVAASQGQDDVVEGEVVSEEKGDAASH